MRQQPDVEQVGFIEAPMCSQAVARLQMMGGEFCGNATCALGWVLAKKGDFQSGIIEVSGRQEPVLVSVIADKVKMEIPIKCSLSSIKNPSGKTIIELEGITHVICNHPPPLNDRAEARRVLDDLGLTSRKAAGVLYTEPYKDGIAMTPIVWVRDTNSLVKEGACASGSICVAMWRAAISGEESADLPIYQPSGSIIRALARIRNGIFTKASIVGKVEILEEFTLTLYV